KKVDCPGYAYLEQILMHLQRAGARMQEFPISFCERRAGASKVTVGELGRNARDIVSLTWRR
ncbi:MAG: polyprenol monophosphomannose synthase, partial [Pirellulaceae bacterium]